MSHDATPAPDALRQALRSRHHPDAAPALSAALPDGVTRLLQVASGNRNACVEASREFAIDQQELQAAARRFVERMLLAPGANHYRVLGVERDADNMRLKQHQRLLLRLFHPDRRLGDPLADGHARRINEAYQVLCDPTRRRRYDAARQATAPARASATRPVVETTRAHAHATRYRPGRRARRVNPLVARYLPTLILTDLGAAALLLLWGLYLIGSTDTGRFAPATPVTLVEHASEYVQGELPGLIAFGSASSGAGVPGDAACLSEFDDETRSALPEFELIDRVADFVTAYERGDIEVLQTLVSTSPDRHQELIEAYRQRFDDTSARVLIISDLRWTIGCREVRGRGRYLSKWRQSGREQRAAGTLELLFRPGTHGPRLSALREAT